MIWYNATATAIVPITVSAPNTVRGHPKANLIITKYKANWIKGMHTEKDSCCTKQTTMLGSRYGPAPATVATVAGKGLYKGLPSQSKR